MVSPNRNVGNRKSRTSIGSRDKRITLLVRKLVSQFEDPNFEYGGVAFSAIADVWAKVTTVAGRKDFAGVDVGADRVTDIFDIRYRPDMSAEMFIQFDSNIYQILHFENPDYQNRSLLINTKILGDEFTEGASG